jgi:hypothetical protein
MKLNLSYNNVSNILFLQRCLNLKELILHGNKKINIKDINDLRNLILNIVINNKYIINSSFLIINAISTHITPSQIAERYNHHNNINN